MFKCLIPNCTESFQTLQGVKIHTSRKHTKDALFSDAMSTLQNKNNNRCEFCNKEYTNKYTLEKHLPRCSQKKLHDQAEKLKYETALEHAVTVAELKTANTLKDQHIEDLKNIVKECKPTTTVINNINNNYSKNYTQNNHVYSLKEQMKNIVPITDEQAFKMFENTIGLSMQRNQSLNSLEELTRSWVQYYLPDSILVTDPARGIAHWKNGDKNNEHVKDPNCNELAKKLQQAIGVERIDEVIEYIKQKLQSNTGDIDTALRLLHNQQLLAEFKAKTCNKLGPMLTKNAKSCAVQAAQSMQHHKQYISEFVGLVESVYKTNMLYIIFSSPRDVNRIWLQPVCNEAKQLSIGERQPVPTQDTKEKEFKLTTTNKTKPTLRWTTSQFLDFLKYCIVQAFDVPNKQLLAVADCMKQKSMCSELFDNKEQASKNFEQFCEWLTWDRFKERATLEEQQKHQSIEAYEEALVQNLSTTKMIQG